jgi:hypothetical protein
MGLQTGHTRVAHDRVVRRARQQFEPIAGLELDGPLGKPEPDRAGRNDDDLVIVVVVRGIPIARPIGPGSGIQSLLDQSRPKRAGIRHGRGIVPAPAEKWLRRVA